MSLEWAVGDRVEWGVKGTTCWRGRRTLGPGKRSPDLTDPEVLTALEQDTDVAHLIARAVRQVYGRDAFPEDAWRKCIGLGATA